MKNKLIKSAIFGSIGTFYFIGQLTASLSLENNLDISFKNNPEQTKKYVNKELTKFNNNTFEGIYNKFVNMYKQSAYNSFQNKH